MPEETRGENGIAQINSNNKANSAAVIGSYSTILAIASGVVLATIAPILGMVISLVGTVVALAFLRSKMQAEQKERQIQEHDP